MGGTFAAQLLHACTFLLISSAFFLALPTTANAQIWVSSGFELTPPTQLTVSGITFTPGNKTETAHCDTSAVNPTSGQVSPAAAGYQTFLASCTLSGSDGSVVTNSSDCPGGVDGALYNFANGNPIVHCGIDFTPQSGVTYTVNSKHALRFNVDLPGTVCGPVQTVCFSDPLGYYSMNPSLSNPWPQMPTYTGVSSYVSLLQINTVDETCSARGGTCAPQNVPEEWCASTITFFGVTICNSPMYGAGPYWDLALSSEPWQVKCSDVVQGSVTPVAYAMPLSNGNTITATFTPNFGFTIAQAAQVCGFTNFDWQQLVTVQPPPSPFFSVNNPNVPLVAPQGFLDPPPGGYTYELPYIDNAYPFYYNPNPGPTGQSELAAHEPGGTGGTQLNFADGPKDPCLYGGAWAGTADCNGTSAPPGATVQFITHLAGVNSDGSAHDLWVGFTWYSNNNGTSGGAATEKEDPRPMDPGSGTGGATVTSVSETTNYQYPTAPDVSPSTLTFLDGTRVLSTSSGLAYSRVSKTFTGTLTIQNISNDTIDGPFQIVLTSMPSGVALVNATGITGGFPYITIPAVTSLEPGQSSTVSIRISNPTGVLVNSIPLVYSGSFN
jgi:hypothetical protein